MNKKLLLIILCLFMTASLFPETVLVAPLIVYDKDSNKLRQEANPAKKIYEGLTRHWFEGLLSFKFISQENYGEIYTVLDANKACAAEDSAYILFGYVQKNDGNWFGNVKLYDYTTKKVAKEFYASDDAGHYDRFVDTMTENILVGLEVFTGISRDETIEDEMRPFEIRLPVSLFYWSPIDSDWHSKLLGLAGIGVGADIYPPQPKMVLRSMLFDFYARLCMSYSYAMGQDGSYPLNYNGIAVGFPLCVHLYFNTRHSIYAGVGPYYEIELMSVTPKYEDAEFHYQNIFGLGFLLGYELNMNQRFSLFTEVGLDVHLNTDTFVAVRPAVGVSFNLYRREK